MHTQLRRLSRLQSFDNRMDALYRGGLARKKFQVRKPTPRQSAFLGKRTTLKRGIGRSLLDRYERMRQSRIKSNVIVAVIDSVCQGCFMELTKWVIVDLVQGEHLVACEHCGRILYLDDSSSD